MTSKDIFNEMNKWIDWASKEEVKRYDIALLKIWIQLEKFISELFVNYAIGGQSETGYHPKLKLNFKDEQQLNAFLRDTNRTYVDYVTKIAKLSKYIFDDDPFSIAIYDDVNHNCAYVEIFSIRNYIAHESGEAKIKYIKTCFGNNQNNFKEPNDYLQSIKKSTKKSYFTYYIDTIRDIVAVLIQPPV